MDERPPDGTTPASDPPTDAHGPHGQPERPPPAEAERRSAVGCAWAWWVVILLFLALLIWIGFTWWRGAPPATPANQQAPATAPGQPPP
jgi:hypothetical protein